VTTFKDSIDWLVSGYFHLTIVTSATSRPILLRSHSCQEKLTADVLAYKPCYNC